MILGPNTLKFEENYCGKITFTSQYVIQFKCDAFECHIEHGKENTPFKSEKVDLNDAENTIVKLIQTHAIPNGDTVVSVVSKKIKQNEYRSMMETFLSNEEN